MIVVADSGPLHYMILLEHVDLLLERLKTTSFYLDEALVNTVFEPWLKP